MVSVTPFREDSVVLYGELVGSWVTTRDDFGVRGGEAARCMVVCLFGLEVHICVVRLMKGRQQSSTLVGGVGIEGIRWVNWWGGEKTGEEQGVISRDGDGEWAR